MFSARWEHGNKSKKPLCSKEFQWVHGLGTTDFTGNKVSGEGGKPLVNAKIRARREKMGGSNTLHRIKTFTASGADPDKVAAKAEREANDWLKQKPTVEVDNIQTCVVNGDEYSSKYTFYLTLLYR